MSTSIRIQERLVGILMVCLLFGVAALVAGLYTQAFKSTVRVVVRADRAGLLMAPGNKVVLHGVEVGKVAGIAQIPDGVALTVGLNPDATDRIPQNITAKIVPTTVFGTKYISLGVPGQPSAERISEGDVIANESVTVEVNTVFDNLASVLNSVDVAKLNATLGNLASALDGRGDDIATLASELDSYLGKLGGDLPALRRDLRAGSHVADTLSDVSPELFRILRNATFTSGTITSEAAALDAVLADVSALGTRARRVVSANGEKFVDLFATLRPTTGLLAEYSPGLGCFISGLAVTDRLLRDAVGGTNPGLNLDSSVVPMEGAYTYPEDLPKVAADNGPACHGLPKLTPGELPAQPIDTDTGADAFPHDDNKLRTGHSGVAQLLFGPLAVGREEPR